MGARTESVADYFYITTSGWGVWDQNEVTNTTGVGCWNQEGTVSGNPVYRCPSSPSWSSSNMPAGKETEVDEYASDGTTLLKVTKNSYTLNCAPAGDPSTPVPSWDTDGKWWTISPGTTGSPHLLVTELDQDNPIVVCDPQLSQQQTILVDGGSLSTAPTTTVTYAYDTNLSVYQVQQISKGQRRTSQVLIKPKAKGMQRDLRCQPSLESSQGMRALFCHPKAVIQFLKGRFHDLAQPGQPAAQRLGPRS